MQRNVLEYSFFLCVFTLSVVGSFAYTLPAAAPGVHTIDTVRNAVRSPVPATSTPVLFVGDVMLARTVETLMHAHGTLYPFVHVQPLFETYPYIIGNFEAVIPKEHVPTKPMTFRFSVPEDFAPALAEVGFTHFFLANNHAHDFGKEGREHTVNVLREAGIEAYGTPQVPAVADVAVLDLGTFTVGIVPINATGRLPEMDALLSALAHATSSSDVTLAYVHWGEEYQPTPTAAQEDLARTLVDLGVDGVIGHHPHVLQGVEVYKHAPIFYSLGNFVFDQYWNSEVQMGLMVSLARFGDRLDYVLHPVRGVQSVPQPLAGLEREGVLGLLAARSTTTLNAEIMAGRISVPFASSTQ
jgi:gamma-polyglutamate biosynthesis protein CapA